MATPRMGAHRAPSDKSTDVFRPAAQEFFSVDEAAVHLGTGVRFVRRLIAERRIPYYKLGRHVRIQIQDLKSYLRDSRVEAMTVTDVWQDMRRAA